MATKNQAPAMGSNNWQKNKPRDGEQTQAVEVAQKCDALDRLEALERVIQKSFLDCNRLDDSRNTGNIQTVAGSMIQHLLELPNCFIWHNGLRMHFLERLYYRFMEEAEKPFPVTAIDLKNAYKSLKREWDEAARPGDGTDYTDETLRDLDAQNAQWEGVFTDEELDRREQLILATRPAWYKPPAQRAAPPAPAKKIIDGRPVKMGIGKTLDSFAGLISQNAPEIAGNGPKRAAKVFDVRESGRECLERLGVDPGGLAPDVLSDFEGFSADWQKFKGYPLDQIDVEVHFEKWREKKREREAARKSGKKSGA